MGALKVASSTHLAHKASTRKALVETQCVAAAVSPCGGGRVALSPVPALGSGSIRDGASSKEREHDLTCVLLDDDDVGMTRAYEAIARLHVEYAPRPTACMEESVRLREMQKYIFCQSRLLAEQMLCNTVVQDGGDVRALSFVAQQPHTTSCATSPGTSRQTRKRRLLHAQDQNEADKTSRRPRRVADEWPSVCNKGL